MSREIKFRTWDIDNKEFVYISETVDGEIWINNGLSTVEMPTHKEPYEQYTGLKDKNGKEIYEGDILQDEKGEKCKVKWNNNEAHFGLYVGKQIELTDFIWMEGKDVEVIGNIHENSELFGGANE